MKAVVQWVLRTMMKDQTGIVRTMPKKDLIDFNVAITMEKLMRNGIDPNALKNANQVENVINQIEAPRNVQQGITSTKSAKVFNTAGEELDPNQPIIGGTQTGKKINTDAFIRKAEAQETEAEILKRLNEDNKKTVLKIKKTQKMIDDAIENVSPGFSNDLKVDADLVAEDLATRMGKVYDDLPTKERLDLYDKSYRALSKKRFDQRQMQRESLEDFVDDAGGVNPDDPRGIDDFIPDPEDMAQGGRAGFKEGSGMTRRSFLKILGGLAAVPIVGKFFKLAKVGKTVQKVPVIQTDNVAGKPEWFDALVNKVILEGGDVTKKFATGERQSIHQKTLDDGSVVRVTEDVDDGAVRVEYESDANVFEDTVQMEYKKPLPDEGAPNPAAEFSTAESGPVGRQQGPDDFDIDIDEVGGSSISDLDSDVSKLKEYATGKKPTMKEFVQNKKRKDRARQITEDPEAQSDALIRRQGEALDYDDYASGGIARMLGE